MNSPGEHVWAAALRLVKIPGGNVSGKKTFSPEVMTHPQDITWMKENLHGHVVEVMFHENTLYWTTKRTEEGEGSTFTRMCGPT